MPDDFNKDIQIHIHEHVGPLRERLGRVEGKLEVNEREITLLRRAIDEIRETLQRTSGAILDKFNAHEEEEWGRYARIESSVQSLRNWIIGITMGIAGLWVVLEFLVKSGIFVLGTGGH